MRQNLKDGVTFDFRLKRRSNTQKIIPILEFAKLKHAKKISKLFKEEYKGTYPFREMENTRAIRKMIRKSSFNWLIFKIKSNKVIGCIGYQLELKEKKSYFIGLVIKKKYRGLLDLAKLFLGGLYALINYYKSTILIWYCELRTIHSISQYMANLIGFNIIGFLPNKDVYLNRIESDFFAIAYNKDALTKFRCNSSPKIIPEVQNCFLFSNKKLQLGQVEVLNPLFELDYKKTALIKKSLIKKREKLKFGYEKISFSINNSESFFDYFYNTFVQNFEKVKYKVSNIEELYVFVLEMRDSIKKQKIRYVECFVSAYQPLYQKVFIMLGFTPRGYIPSWRYNQNQKYFEDYIIFNYYVGEVNRDIKLIPETEDFLKILNFIK